MQSQQAVSAYLKSTQILLFGFALQSFALQVETSSIVTWHASVIVNIDNFKAILLYTPLSPDTPASPFSPLSPSAPVSPVGPDGPRLPLVPLSPLMPTSPIEPSSPAQPIPQVT